MTVEFNGASNLKVNAELTANGNLQLEATGANTIVIGGKNLITSV